MGKLTVTSGGRAARFCNKIKFKCIYITKAGNIYRRLYVADTDLCVESFKKGEEVEREALHMWIAYVQHRTIHK